MDTQQAIVEQVQAALEREQPLSIHGGRSKDFYGHPAQGEALDVSQHSGIIDYDPGELVMTCRAGTRLEEIRATLAENGQHLPFEPPAFGESATLGGTVACGFSGPRRPWSGSLRDYLLGVKLVNGEGEVVQFGGQVMKNVAGYDVSRLVAGSMGTLGVILETSFKVLPLPETERTLRFECSQEEAIRRVNQWSARPLPVSGASWREGQLMLRLSGTRRETERTCTSLEPDSVLTENGHWLDLREHTLEFFAGPAPLWRLSVPPATPPLALDGPCMIDWGGAQRWYRTDASAAGIREAAEAAGGHATRFRGEGEAPVFHPLAPLMQRLQKRVRQAMDPSGLFNPGRLGPQA